MEAADEQKQQQQQQARTLLADYGALLMQHCRRIQQELQEATPLDGATAGDREIRDGDRVEDTAARLRTSLRVLALHSDYSGRFFDLFRLELRGALSLEASEQTRLTQQREASQLLKEVCLRSKEMSHDVIKASRELVHSFKTEQRVDDRRRSSSILSRAREIAKATIGRRSVSRSSGVVAAASELQAHEEMVARQQAQVPTPQTTPLPQPLVTLERSPRARSPNLSKEDEQPPLSKEKAVAGQRVPAPPRRSSSLNSLPPELRAVWPAADSQQQLNQQHLSGGSTHSSRLHSTENCLKTILSTERHQLMRPSPSQPQRSPQSLQPTKSARGTLGSVGSSAASSAATAELPSDASSLSSSVDDVGETEKIKVHRKHKNLKGRIVDAAQATGATKKVKERERKPQYCSAYATTDMDVRLSELDEDTITRVTELAEDETGFFNNTSDIISTSEAADLAKKLTNGAEQTPVQVKVNGRMGSLNKISTTLKQTTLLVSDKKPDEEVYASEPEAAHPASTLGTVRQKKLQSAGAAAAAATASSAAPTAAGLATMTGKVRHQRRRRVGTSGRIKTLPPVLSNNSGSGFRPMQLYHHHHQQQPRRPRNMFSNSSSDSSCSDEDPAFFSVELDAATKGSGSGTCPKQLLHVVANGFMETDL